MSISAASNVDSGNIGEQKMSDFANHAAAALAAVFICAASIAGIVHVPHADGAIIASAPIATLA